MKIILVFWARLFESRLTLTWDKRLTAGLFFSCLKMFFTCNVWCSLKQKGKQYKQNTSPESYKTKIKIPANPTLA